MSVALIDLHLESSGGVTQEPAFDLAPRSLQEWSVGAKAHENKMVATVRDARDSSSELNVFLLLEGDLCYVIPLHFVRILLTI